MNCSKCQTIPWRCIDVIFDDYHNWLKGTIKGAKSVFRRSGPWTDFFPYLQTSLLLSWMLFGGSRHILLGEQMNTSQEMTSWLKVDYCALNISLKSYYYSVLYQFGAQTTSWGSVELFCCLRGHKLRKCWGHPPRTMEQTRGSPSPLYCYSQLLYASIWLIFIGCETIKILFMCLEKANLLTTLSQWFPNRGTFTSRGTSAVARGCMGRLWSSYYN